MIFGIWFGWARTGMARFGALRCGSDSFVIGFGMESLGAVENRVWYDCGGSGGV